MVASRHARQVDEIVVGRISVFVVDVVVVRDCTDVLPPLLSSSSVEVGVIDARYPL
jgi:hypothetical protein